VRHVLVEGGPTLAAAFLRAGLVDEVYAYIAPVLLGGGPSAIGDLGITAIADAVRLVPREPVPLGPDVLVVAAVQEHAAGRPAATGVRPGVAPPDPGVTPGRTDHLGAGTAPGSLPGSQRER
jgi:diaminohydroxyphosphoribosylaminopyrimidine deaminase/5-amino-6-(5-phosphoribosylamino)uracil reductase